MARATEKAYIFIDTVTNRRKIKIKPQYTAVLIRTRLIIWEYSYHPHRAKIAHAPLKKMPPREMQIMAMINPNTPVIILVFIH